MRRNEKQQQWLWYQNEVEANREEKLVEKEAKGSSRTNVEDKRSPEDVLKEMQMQKTHDLYCPNCTHNITRTAELFEKGKEKFQYNNENIILSFVIVVSFKYPFIFLPWFYNNTPGMHVFRRVFKNLLHPKNPKKNLKQCWINFY